MSGQNHTEQEQRKLRPVTTLVWRVGRQIEENHEREVNRTLSLRPRLRGHELN